METYIINNQEELDKFEDDYGYTIDGNAEFNISARFSGRLNVSGYLSIEAGGSIEAGYFIKAGGSIEAGTSIKAGTSIEAGSSIEATLGGITCGLHITCKGLLKFKLRLFAGISPYSSYDNCSNDVTCGKLDGKVVYGNVIETGLPEEADAPEEPKEKFVTDEDGKKYKLVEVDNE